MDLKLVCALIVPLRGKRAQVTMVLTKTCIALLLVSSGAFAQVSGVAAAVEAPAGLPVCTPEDAQKYEAYSKEQCKKLEDIRLIGPCTVCAITRTRNADLKEIDISNMLAGVESSVGADKCLRSADKYFNGKGPGFSLRKKEEWLEKCYEREGAIIKQGDESAEVPFDLSPFTRPSCRSTRRATANTEDRY